MKILMASSEMSPLAKTGGLGDVLGALPAQLQRNGHDAAVVLPYYQTIHDDASVTVKPTGMTITVPLGERKITAEILVCRKGKGVPVYLVQQEEFFDRPGLYGEGGKSYEDEASRFIFFSKAVVELAGQLSPKVDIIHCHDWQTALVPVLVKAKELPFKTMLTIHNLAYQGSFWGLDFGLTNLPAEYFSASGVEFYGQMNLMKGGILFADVLTTVSDAYARDILTPEFGCGLDGVLTEHRDKLRGFLNGADYSRWSPSKDKYLPKTYRPTALVGKKASRSGLLKHLGLKAAPKGPVFMMTTRLAEQKGFDILLPIIDRIMADDVRLVILGEGDPSYEAELTVAMRKYADKLAFVREFDEKLAHLMQAGADVALVPSRFEPCGLSAIYSLKYGTVPVARSVGGLHQILRDYDPGSEDGWGFLFFDYSSEALWDAIVRAKKAFAKPKVWKALMRQAMAQDFSWEKAVPPYEAVYFQLLKKP